MRQVKQPVARPKSAGRGSWIWREIGGAEVCQTSVPFVRHGFLYLIKNRGIWSIFLHKVPVVSYVFFHIIGRKNGRRMSAGRLTVAKVRQLNEPGRYADGGCLYLVVAPGGSKHWVARLTIHGRQTDMGLGGLSIVSLADARDEAARLRKIARTGGDPRLERKREQLTFAGAAKHVHEGLLPTWKNTKHAETWIASLERHAFPVVGDPARPERIPYLVNLSSDRARQHTVLPHFL
jgi:hypothetical protein